MSDVSCCDSCSRYVYNEDYECYEGLAYIDEDEYSRLLSGSDRSCPYYCRDDEYGIVRKQN